MADVNASSCDCLDIIGPIPGSKGVGIMDNKKLLTMSKELQQYTLAAKNSKLLDPEFVAFMEQFWIDFESIRYDLLKETKPPHSTPEFNY